MRNNLISVIMPVFNAEKYLNDILTDLLGQTYDNMEIIIVDGGSIDLSWKIIQEFSKKDERIRAIQVENSGPSKSRNIGLDVSLGDYIRFIDADDRIPKNSIQEMKEAMENEDVDLIIGNYRIFPEQNYYTGELKENKVVNIREFTKEFIRNMKSFYYGVTWNKLYKREVIERYSIRFDEKLFWCEDFIFNLDYYTKIDRIYLLSNENGYYDYCRRENSITNTLNKRNSEEISYANQLRYQKVFEFCEKQGLQQEVYIQWKYSYLYDELTSLSKVKRIRDFKGQYKQFKRILNNKEIYLYVTYKEYDSKIWYILKRVLEKKCYFLGFTFFYLKWNCGRVIGLFSPDIRKKIKKILPKSL